MDSLRVKQAAVETERMSFPEYKISLEVVATASQSVLCPCRN